MKNTAEVTREALEKLLDFSAASFLSMENKPREKWQILNDIRNQPFYGKKNGEATIKCRRPVPYIAMENGSTIQFKGDKATADTLRSADEAMIRACGIKRRYDPDSLITNRMRDLLGRLESGEIKKGERMTQADIDLIEELKPQGPRTIKTLTAFLREKLYEIESTVDIKPKIRPFQHVPSLGWKCSKCFAPNDGVKQACWACGKERASSERRSKINSSVDWGKMPERWHDTYKDKDTLRRIILGEFKPDQRTIDLEDRMQAYYDATPDDMSNKDALPFWHEFRAWCDARGYSHAEIVAVKNQKRFRML